jgi:hypothetical protein
MRGIIILLILFSLQIYAGIGVGYSNTEQPPVPVELTSFTAKLAGNNVELQWVTATEVKNYGFEIERSSVKDGDYIVVWEKIGFVKGNGTSNSPKQYSFLDDKPITKNSQYRLKQIDNDGTFKYSAVIKVGSVLIKEYRLEQNYPNPFNPSTNISYSIPAYSKVVVSVYDILGNLITTLVDENQETGSYIISFNAGGLSNGIYFFKLQAGSFVDTKKMLLLK